MGGSFIHTKFNNLNSRYNSKLLFSFFVGSFFPYLKTKKRKKMGVLVRNDILGVVSIPCHTQNELMCFFFWLDLYPSGLTGLEPAASALTGRCSDQLNYNPRKKWYSIHIFTISFKSFLFPFSIPTIAL